MLSSDQPIDKLQSIKSEQIPNSQPITNQLPPRQTSGNTILTAQSLQQQQSSSSLSHSTSSLSVNLLSLNRSNSQLVSMPYVVNDMIDCQDTMSVWLEARIAQIDDKKQQVYVNFEGWPNQKWHEWLHYKDKRIAKHYTHFIKPDKQYIIRHSESFINDTIQKLTSIKNIIVQEVLKLRNHISTLPTDNSSSVDDGTLSTLLIYNNTQYALQPINELLSSNDIRYILHQNGVRCMSIILNGQLEPKSHPGPDDTVLLNKSVALLRLLVIIISYAIMSSKLNTLNNLWFQMLARIIGGIPSFFYNKYGTNTADRDTITINELTELNLSDKAQVYASRDSPGGALRPYVGLSPQTSIYLIQNINLFGTLGGFDSVQYHILNHSLSLQSIVLYIHTLAEQKNILIIDFVKAYVQSLQLVDAVQRSITSMSDDVLKNRNDEQFTLLISDTQILLSLINTSTESQAEFIELTKLALSTRMINSGVLQSRLDGITSIDNTVKLIAKTYGSPSNPSRLPNTNVISPSRMIEYLDKHNVLSGILAKDSHEQVVKRSALLLRFLAFYERLDNKYIDLLFLVSTTTKAESMTRIVYDLLSDLSSNLNDEQLDIIYTRLSNNIDKIRDIDITFIKNLSKNAVRRQGRNKSQPLNKSMMYGTDILYNIVIQHGPHSQLAENSLAELLSIPEYSYLLNMYIDKCVSIIENNESKNVTTVIYYINLLQNILQSIPADINKNSNNGIVCVRNEYIEHIHNNNIIDLIINDLLYYHSIALQQKVKQQYNEHNEQSIDLIIHNISHKQHIATRFHFFTFIINNSYLVPTTQHFDQLNEIFVLNSIDIYYDSNLLFQYLTQCVDGKNGRTEYKQSLSKQSSYQYTYGELPFKLHLYIFEHILCNTQHIPYFTETTYSCFESYFVYINYGIDNLENSQRSSLSVLNYKNLQGMEYFFMISINCINSTVSSHASFFLISCYLRIDKHVKYNEKKLFLFQFIDKCMNELIQQIVSNDMIKIRRIVEMLNKFLVRLSNGELPGFPLYTIGQKCKYYSSNKQWIPCKIQQVNTNQNYTIKLMDQNNSIEYNVSERYLQPLDMKSMDVQPITDQPKILLSTNKQYYDTLYNVLDIDDDVIKDLTLNILHQIPMNNEYLHRIESIEKLDKSRTVDWNLILPHNSVNKLHFLIDTIKGYVESNQTYCIGFIANNGLTQLLQLIDINNKSQNSTLFQSKLTNILTISSIIQIIARILHNPQLYKAAIGRVDEQSIIDILLNLCVVILQSIDALNLNQYDESILNTLNNTTNNIIQSMFTTIDIVLNSNTSLIDTCSKNKNWVTIIELGILNKNIMIRKTMNINLYTLLNHQIQLITQILHILYNALVNKIDSINSSNTFIVEYFDLYKSLYDIYYTQKLNEPTVTQLNDQLINLIAAKLNSNYPIIEKSNSIIYCDHYLNGIVLLLIVLVTHHPQYTTECYSNHITDNLLRFVFDLPKLNELDQLHPPHMKTEILRSNAFSLLKLLSSDIQNQSLIINKLQHYHDNSHSNNSQLSNWSFYARVDDRAAHGYAGINNLGCICFDINTEVLVWVTDRQYGWIGGDDLLNLWNSVARPNIKIASLREVNGVNCMVYSHLNDIVAPFVYDTRYQADQHPVRIRTATPDGIIDLLVTPDHGVYAAPVQLIREQPRIDGDNKSLGQEIRVLNYRMVPAAELLNIPKDFPGIASQFRGWTIPTSCPFIRDPTAPLPCELTVGLDNELCFTLPSLATMNDAAINQQRGDIVISHHHSFITPPAQYQRTFTFAGDNMDTWLVFIGFHLADGSSYTRQVGGHKSGWLRYYTKYHTGFIRGVWNRLQHMKHDDGQYVFGAHETRDRDCWTETSTENEAIHFQWDNTWLAMWTLYMELHTSKQSSYKLIPGWIWYLTPRQIQLLLVGMAHGDGALSKVDTCDGYCKWCNITHRKFVNIITHTQQHANEIQRLCMHAGWSSTIAYYNTSHTINNKTRHPEPGYYEVTINSTDTTVKTHSIDNNISYIKFDTAPAVRKQRFWCVTTAETSHVVLVRRRVDDYSAEFPNTLCKPGMSKDGYMVGDKWVTAFVGNCYMNAPLQNLYMIPQLRQNIFNVTEFTDIYNDESAPKKTIEQLELEKQSGELDSLVYQLQYMFANLQASDEQAYSPINFIRSFKDEYNKPTDVRVQDDSGSFVQKLLDRLNMALKTTHNSNNGISGVLGGVLAHDLIGKDTCTHKRTREEEFFGLQVEVENQRSLIDSLQSYISTELLDGSNAYRCDECAAKVSTIKRVSIKQLPDTLFFVLKRFALDYNTMETVKINEKMIFPMTLNMKQFTKQYVDSPDVELDDTLFQYELRGVVVHTGSAQGGHYYSFIMDRASRLWYKFNDSIVTEFDPADIPDECFGGYETVSMNVRQTLNESNQNNNLNTFEKFRNAYILFYDKIQPNTTNNTNTTVTSSPPGSNTNSVTPVDRYKCELPAELSRLIHEANATAWLDKMVYDGAYMDFLSSVYRDINKSTPQSNKQQIIPIIHLATNFLLNTVARSMHKQKYFMTWITICNRLYEKYSTISYEYVVTLFSRHPYWLERYSLHCPDQEVRQQIGSLISTCITRYGNTVDYDRNIISISEQLAEQWEYMVCQLNWSDAYWKWLCSVVTLNQSYAYYITNKYSLLGKLIDFYLGDGTSLINPQSYQVLSLSNSNKMRGRLGLYQLQRTETVPWIIVLKLLHGLVKCYQQPQFDTHSITSNQNDNITSNDAATTTDMELSRKMSESVVIDTDSIESTVDFSTLLPLDQYLQILIQNDNHVIRDQREPLPCTLIQHADCPAHARELAGIYTHWCWNNQSCTVLLIQCITRNIHEKDYYELRSHIRVVNILCSINDSLQRHRVDWLLSSLLQAIQTQGKYWKLMDWCIEHIIRLAKLNQLVYQWLTQHTPYVRSLLMYLEAHPNCPLARTKYASMSITGNKDDIVALKPTNNNSSLLYNAHSFTNYGLITQQKIDTLQLIIDNQSIDTDNTTDSEIDLYDRTFKVGDLVDVQDQNKWLCAKVVAVEPHRVQVKYQSYVNSYDWLAIDSSRILPLGTHTSAAQQANRLRQVSRDSDD